uniref:Fibrinogen C-terminal domain-containing protein n=1 Tax=Macrostomum lignano TaxID=282301 RepID=A0A1I8GM29_9PLAT
TFARGPSDNGGIYLRLIRGEQDWFQQRGVTFNDYFFMAWLEEYKIHYDEISMKSDSQPSPPPSAKCSHPEDQVRLYMMKDGCYDPFQYDYSYVVECQACNSKFAKGQTDFGAITLKYMRGDKDWFQQRGVTEEGYYFEGWLKNNKIKNIEFCRSRQALSGITNT